jgi:hypothetical protein
MVEDPTKPSPSAFEGRASFRHQQCGVETDDLLSLINKYSPRWRVAPLVSIGEARRGRTITTEYESGAKMIEAVSGHFATRYSAADLRDSRIVRHCKSRSSLKPGGCFKFNSAGSCA